MIVCVRVCAKVKSWGTCPLLGLLDLAPGGGGWIHFNQKLQAVDGSDRVMFWQSAEEHGPVMAPYIAMWHSLILFEGVEFLDWRNMHCIQHHTLCLHVIL